VLIKNLKQLNITNINNLSWILVFVNFFKISKKSPFLKAVFWFFLSILIISQTLGISHLIAHNYQDKSTKHQLILSTEFTNQNSQILSDNDNKISNCNLCNFANLQKKLINFVIILNLGFLINLIFKRKFLLTNISSIFQTKRCRAPPFFA